MGVKWTEEQEKVIRLRDSNILVSAAAGSGKTAVLVERIISRITRDNPPLDIDRLLVVTYTEAAAAEMKERIARAVEQALLEQPDSVHLKKQAALVHTARITTIHSFCLSVIREYFHTIDLDPGFRVAEEGELRLLKQDVLSELLEERYQEGSSRFLRFAETFSPGRDDRKLEELVLELYEASGAFPDAREWLEDCADEYRKGLSGDSRWMKRLVSYIKASLNAVEDMIEKARKICLEPGGPAVYEKALDADKKLIKNMQKAAGFEELWFAFWAGGKAAFSRLPAARGEELDEKKTEEVKNLRNQWKKALTDLKEQFFFQKPEEMERDFQLCIPVTEELVSLVLEFEERFRQQKNRKNLIDFRDMEQYALQILTRKENGKRVPTEAALDYQERFEEVMVDEYQDSNLLQEAVLTSVSRNSRGGHNLFMVGDVKQSIYRFRLARPELFLEKYHTYAREEGPDCRIDLHRNFRSRPEVLESVNALFRRLMVKELGGITYDEEAALNPGAEFPETSGCGTEILVVDAAFSRETEQDSVRETRQEMEARAVAERIHRLMAEQKIRDEKTGNLRPVQYRDIVILTRSLKGWTDAFSRVLNREGIPVAVASREGYFQTLEIGWLMDYLRILDNLCQDIPLAGALKSPFGGMTGEELALIRAACPEGPFYRAVLSLAGQPGLTGELAEVAGKLRNILEQAEEFREKVPYTPVSDLLWEILQKTGYREYVLAMPGGEQRAANLDMLLVRARAFESASYRGLFHFVRYVDQLEKYDMDFGEAQLQDETSDTVRLMSIHKSKGLEFPVVIVAGMGKQFNEQDLRKSVVIHPDLGLGMDAVDTEKRTKSPSLLKKVIQKETALENLGEELRILYVAMTRAKEKLILTGMVSRGTVVLPEEEEEQENGAPKPLSFLQLAGARTCLDWLLAAARGLPRETPVQVWRVELPALVDAEAARAGTDALEKDWYLKEIQNPESPLAVRDEEFAKRLEAQLSWHYPYEKEENLKLKYTVSELKKRASLAGEEGEELIAEEDAVPLIPAFLQEEQEIAGASRGSAYHRVLELLDFSREYTVESLEQEVDAFWRAGKIPQEMAAAVRPEDILFFLNTESGKRMRRAARAGKLYKEQPFVFGVEAGRISPDADAGELTLIQGIIDVWLEEEDGLVVLDYKTDRVRTAKELTDRYREQLFLYGEALEQMTEKKVKERIIYSFTLREEIEC